MDPPGPVPPYTQILYHIYAKARVNWSTYPLSNLQVIIDTYGSPGETIPADSNYHFLGADVAGGVLSFTVYIPINQAVSPGVVVQDVDPNNNEKAIFYSDTADVPWCNDYEPKIWGYIFVDSNHNGVRDAGEVVVPGSTVQIWRGTTWITNLYGAADSGYWVYIPSVTGSHTVKAVLPSGWTPTTATQYTVDVQVGGNYGPYYFGAYQQGAPTPTPTPTWTPTPPPTPTPSPPLCSTYTATADTFIISNAAFRNNRYGYWSYFDAGTTATALIRFPSVSRPSGMVLQRATLRATSFGAYLSPRTVTSHRITRNWWENINWNEFTNYGATRGWSGSYGSVRYIGPSLYQWDVTSLVKYWIDTGSAQYGIALTGTSSGSMHIYARQTSSPPQLVVCWQSPTPTPTPVASSSIVNPIPIFASDHGPAPARPRGPVH